MYDYKMVHLEQATFGFHLGVSKNRAIYPKMEWFILENPIEMEDLGGKKPLFFRKTPMKRSKYWELQCF